MRRRPHPILRQIIDRDCHVSMSGREVVRHVIGKLREGYQTFREYTPSERRRFIADCLQIHRDNRGLYDDVMRGQPRGDRRGRDQPSSLTGPEIVGLMRKHGRTIAWLAFRVGATERRVRQVREQGLKNHLAVRDWIEAITGTDPGPIPAKHRLTDTEECQFCGVPLDRGDDAYEYVGEVFCSIRCCRHSRGWN